MELSNRSRGKETEMKQKCNHYRKLLGLTGAILIFLPERLPNVWGNMIVYVTSYSYIRHGSTSVASTWSLSAFTIGSCLGINLAGFLAGVGNKKIVFLSVLVFNTGVLSIYYTLKAGLTVALFVAFGIMGFCSGIFASVVFKILIDIAGSSKGRYMSIASAAFNFGSVSVNFFVGFYMNPHNVSPTLMADGMALFEDEDLVQKVPTLFIILGVSYFTCMAIGSCLLFLSYSSHATNTDQEKTSYGAFSNEDQNGIQTTPRCQEIHRNSIPTNKTDYDSQESVILCSSGVLTSGHNADPIDTKPNSISNTVPTSDTPKSNGIAEQHNSTTDTNSDADDDDDDESQSTDDGDKGVMTVREILAYIPFYAMCFSLASGLFPSFLLNAWYKTYGLVHIKDDQLLTVFGSVYPLVGGISRVVWGFVLDKLPVKTCLLIVYGYLSATIMIMYFSPIIHQNMYFTVTLLVGIGTSIILPTFLVVCVVYFGDRNFQKVYAMLKSSRGLFALIVSPVFEGLQGEFGWFVPFCCTSFITTVSLILIATVIPYVRCLKSK